VRWVVLESIYTVKSHGFKYTTYESVDLNGEKNAFTVSRECKFLRTRSLPS